MQESKLQRGDTALAVKAGFWYVVSSFLVKGMAFITTPIFARLMSEAAYGEFSNFASWQATLLIIAGAELYNTVARAYYDYQGNFDGYVSSITITSCLITMILYLICVLFGEWVFKIVAIPQQYVHVLFFVLMCQSCKQIFMARERTLYRYKTVAAMSFVNLVIPTTIAIVLVMLAPETERLSARIYGFYIPSALIGLCCFITLMKRGRKGVSFEHVRYAFKLALPMIVHYLTAYLLTSTNVIITKNVLGAEIAAIVSISSSTIHILTVLFQSISGALTTWLMDNLAQKQYRKIRRGSLYYGAGLALVALGVMLLAPEVVWVLGGKKYADAVYLIPSMVVAVTIQSMTTFFTIILTYDKNITKTAIATTIVAAMSLVAKVVLLKLYGYQALPFTNMVAFGILFAVNYLLVKRAGYAETVNIKGLCLLIAALIGLMVCSYLLYRNRTIRYCVVAAVAIAALFVVWKFRSHIMRLLHKRRHKKKAHS